MSTVRSSSGEVDKLDIGKLKQEHEQLEFRLGELTRRVYLSAEEAMEVQKLKKLKLMKKDLIEAMKAEENGGLRH